MSGARGLYPIERFLSKIDIDRSGCWIWTAGRQGKNYGWFWADSRGVLAHRWSYGYFVGPIPDGLVLDHLCRTTMCVNPEHLEAVTFGENVLRGESPHAVHARKTHCLRGHPFDGRSSYVNAKGRRVCRLCVAARYAKRVERNRSAKHEAGRPA